MIRIYHNLYEEMISLDNLNKSYKKARKGKGDRWYVIEFESDLERNIMRIHEELKALDYEPRMMKRFVIRDPKTRIIFASDFRDRIVHHALCNVIEPIFEKLFIHDSYANRKRKGVHAALKRFDIFKKKVSGNGRMISDAKDNNMVYGYVLKADIKHYFQSIDHEILAGIIGRKIKDEKAINLIKKIIDNNFSKTKGKGMPIGNLTSQLFANIYLNEFDYFVKHNFRAKYYIRYMDDFVILDSSKEKLEAFKYRTNSFLKSELEIELHPEKSRVIPLKNGVNFLGFRVFYHHKLLKKSNIKIINKRIDNFIKMSREGLMNKDKVMERLEGWNAYAMHGNTYKLRKRIEKRAIKGLNL